jgi:hypothetical protein
MYEKNDRPFIELPLEVFEALVRNFLAAMPTNDELYVRHNPSLVTLDDVRRHWIQHGYFEGRLMYGWENFPFPSEHEMSYAPQVYYDLLRAGASSTQARKYRAAEEYFGSAIDQFPSGIAARFALAELLFRLRRPADSKAILADTMRIAPMPLVMSDLYVDVLLDLNQTDLACSVSLETGSRANTALQVLRLLSRDDLATARRQVALATDDWPVIASLKNRISADQQHERERFRHLRFRLRHAGSPSRALKAELAHCLARLGYRNWAVATLSAVQADPQSTTATNAIAALVWSARTVTIIGGCRSGFEFLNLRKDAWSGNAEVRLLWFRYAYQCDENAVISKFSEELTNEVLPIDFLETFVSALILNRRLDQALELCKRHWASVTRHTWLSGAVMQIARLQGRFAGVAMDEPAGDMAYNATIPRRIMQFWDRDVPPDDVRQLIESFKERNPACEHILFSNRTATEFLLREYGPEFVAIFEYCHHPAMACDFFRLAYLARVGGIYADADEFCNRPLEDLIESYPSRNFFASISEASFFVNNRFLCTAAQHPLMLRVLKHVVEDMRTAMVSGTKPDIWTATGPFQYTRAFAEMLMADDDDTRSTIGQIGLVYTNELTHYLGAAILNYKQTKEGNWRAS